MARSVFTKVSGLREIGESMRGLSFEMNTKIARAATGAGAALIKKRWRAGVPVAPKAHKQNGIDIEPGTYRDNIVTKKVPATQTKLTSEHVVVVRGGRKNKFASHIASLLEFGTVHIPPKGYGRKAYDATKADAVEAAKAKLKAGIKKA